MHPGFARCSSFSALVAVTFFGLVAMTAPSCGGRAGAVAADGGSREGSSPNGSTGSANPPTAGSAPGASAMDAGSQLISDQCNRIITEWCMRYTGDCGLNYPFSACFSASFSSCCYYGSTCSSPSPVPSSAVDACVAALSSDDCKTVEIGGRGSPAATGACSGIFMTFSQLDNSVASTSSSGPSGGRTAGDGGLPPGRFGASAGEGPGCKPSPNGTGAASFSSQACTITHDEACDGGDYRAECACPQGTCACYGGASTQVVNFPGCPSCPSPALAFQLCGFPYDPNRM